MNPYKKKFNVNTKNLSLNASKIESCVQKYKISPKEKELKISPKEGELKIGPIKEDLRISPMKEDLIIIPIDEELRISIIDRISGKNYGFITLLCDAKNRKSIMISPYVEYIIQIESLFRDIGIFYELEQGTINGIELRHQDPIRIYCYGDIAIRGYRMLEKGAFLSIPSKNKRGNKIVLKFRKMRINVDNVEEAEKVGEFIYKLKLYCCADK